MIVVTAAGGKTGTAVVRALRDRGEDVRAVVGSDRPRPALEATGADALYLIWPNVEPSEAAGAPLAFRAAAAAGVGRVVYHSVLRPQLRSMPHHAAKDRAEDGLDGGTFEAVGPQPLTAPDLAAVQSTHLGRPPRTVADHLSGLAGARSALR